MTETTKKDNIDKYYVMLCDDINFIPTINNFERYCVYMALEKYAINKQDIWCQRKKEWIGKNFNIYVWKAFYSINVL